MTHAYQLGEVYRDKASPTDREDEFMAWINIEKSRMMNSPGVRPLPFTSLKLAFPAYLVLVTHQVRRAGNPWEDMVDLSAGRILYWGDAKYDPPGRSHRRLEPEDFIGNRALATVRELVLEGRYDLVPPILHFSKPRSGYVAFNGLCVLGDLERTWFEDKGQPVKNYRAHLTVLDEQFVDVEWLHRRALATSERQLSKDGPPAWRRYQRGKVDRLSVWKTQIRTPSSQLPLPGSPEDNIRAELVDMTPTEFEAAVVSLFREWKSVTHSIARTRPTGDQGFDFFGRFILPPPLHYEINFLGEAKRYSRKTAVTPAAVSRLVARLGRGEYGIFVTTSFFTEQAQEEVYADRYPVRLLPGGDLVEMMKELRVASRGTISGAWLQAVKEEFESRPWLRED